MRYAILADIHSNLTAFQAVLEDIEKRGGVEELWCLGDVVGYGPDPQACIELLRQQKHLCVAGNHDWAATGKLDLSDFNPDAAAACLWTGTLLQPEERDYLASLPLTASRLDFTLAHGSPREPLWEYLLSPATALANFAHSPFRFCLVGHSHIPILFELGENTRECQMLELSPESPLTLGERRLIINPGGVGQPRDSDPRASYVIYATDSSLLHHHRVAYDIAATQEKMLKLRLPARLAARLSYGW